MAFATANGAPIASAAIFLPPQGAWEANLSVDTEEDFTGPITIELGEAKFKGFIRRNQRHAGFLALSVVGGNGGLSKKLKAKSYKSVPVKIPVNDVLAEANETLAPAASSNLTRQLSSWARISTTGEVALHNLATYASLVWRVLADGSVWFGVDAWKAWDAKDYVVSREALIDNEVDIYGETQTLTPGMSFLDRKVRHVSHWLSPNSFRTTVAFVNE